VKVKIFKDGDLPDRLSGALVYILVYSPRAKIDVMSWWKNDEGDIDA